jgi:hypothetical protein
MESKKTNAAVSPPDKIKSPILISLIFLSSIRNKFTTSHATVRLDQETLDVIQWAKTQRTMAMNRLTLAENNPALMKALEKLKKAEDDFEILSKFVEHDNIDKK